jgi:hypothetical protein
MKGNQPEPRKCRFAQFNLEYGHIHLLPSSCLHVLRAVSFSHLDALCLYDWGEGKEASTEEWGGEGACEFLSYCLTLLKKNKMF